MSIDHKKKLFDCYQRSLIAAGVNTSSHEMLLCPLCWKGTNYDDFSFEHIVPKSVGGERTILTCRNCNNTHGSVLDSHLAQSQKIKDVFHGSGTIPMRISVEEHMVSANIEGVNNSNSIIIVEEASDPVGVSIMKELITNNEILNLKLYLNYNENNFQTALLRCAYLALFKCFHYKYAKQESVQIIRHRINDLTMNEPNLKTMVKEVHDCRIPYKDPYFIVRGDIEGIDFFLVIIRLRKNTTTYHAVFMPGYLACAKEFCNIVDFFSQENNWNLNFPINAAFT